VLSAVVQRRPISWSSCTSRSTVRSTGSISTASRAGTHEGHTCKTRVSEGKGRGYQDREERRP
jgi:hypothetical protein